MQWLIGFRSREIVRLKAPDAYFLKTKKILILPQFPLMSATIEEGPKSMKIQIFSLKNVHPSSMVAEIKGDWGRIKIFFIFEKYVPRPFKRTIWRFLKGNSCWKNFIWNVLKNCIFWKKWDFCWYFHEKSRFCKKMNFLWKFKIIVLSFFLLSESAK